MCAASLTLIIRRLVWLALLVFTHAAAQVSSAVDPHGGKQFTRVFRLQPETAAEVRDAKSWLQQRGVSFPEGASAVMNRVTSQLIVKNTSASLDQIEAVLAKLRVAAMDRKRILLSAQVAEVSFIKDAREETDAAIERLTMQCLGEIGDPPPQPAPSAGVYTFNGVLSEPQFQLTTRILRQRKNIRLFSMPDATVKHEAKQSFELPKELGGGAIEIKPDLGSDGHTIDLSARFADMAVKLNHQYTQELTIWDGQTFILGTSFNERDKNRRSCLIFITAKIIDSAGK